MTPGTLRSYFCSSLCWDALQQPQRFVLPLAPALSADEIARAGHIVAIAIRTDSPTTSTFRNRCIAAIRNHTPKPLVLFVSDEKIIWSFNGAEMETPALLPSSPAADPFLHQLVISVKGHVSPSHIEQQIMNAFTVQQLQQRPMPQTRDLLQPIFEHLERWVNDLKRNAAKLASDVFINQTTIDFDRLKLLRNTLNEFERKVQILRSEAEHIVSEFPEVLTDSSALTAPRFVTTIPRPSPTKNNKLNCTLQREFRCPILRALIEFGGREDDNRVLDRVEQLMKDRLTPDNYTMVSANEPKWRNYARWERNKMKDKGLLARHSPAGIWEITEEGRQYYKNHCKSC